VLASLGFDQLRADPNAAAGLTQATFEHVTHPKFAADLLHINRAVLVSETGISRDDE
jgi:acetoin utilization deacetylase AcuC-like enzyme